MRTGLKKLVKLHSLVRTTANVCTVAEEETLASCIGGI